MRRRLVAFMAGFALLVGLAPASVLAGGGRGGLDPGETVTYRQKVPVNIVFLGYPRSMIDKSDLLDQMPSEYEPVVRYPQFYGLEGRDMGLEFTFDYDIDFVGQRTTNRFFRFLKRIGEPGDPTDFQLLYNDQVNNVQDVTGPVLHIDAPTVERWLARNLHTPDKGYTIVYINWHSRPDFKYHVYTRLGEPDPDTGYDFGDLRPSRKIIAWGGTNSRLWFYDLSAGPEAWTDNWNVDDPDLDGNGAEEYRMPPIWEYTAGGYRSPDQLSSDLGMVARFVGINLLFTTSPLYDPMVAAPGPGGNRVIHMSMFEDDPASQGTDWLDARYTRARMAQFQPYYDWRARVVDVDPIDPATARALRIFSGVLEEDDCWNAYGDPFAELFCYFDANITAFVPSYGRNDYVIKTFNFNTTEATLGGNFGLLGFADDNWVDGTQSYVFSFGAAEYRELGFGFTSTVVHEVGHHIGMSHPHDGYDSELGLDYGPSDEFYFAWSGDESETVMHYLALSNIFGEFDQDNMYRYEFAGYLNWANGLADDILDDPKARKVRELMRRANWHAKRAIHAFKSWDYLPAAANARRAYVLIARAANRLGIDTPTMASASLQRARIRGAAAPHEGDPIRFPNS